MKRLYFPALVYLLALIFTLPALADCPGPGEPSAFDDEYSGGQGNQDDDCEDALTNQNNISGSAAAVNGGGQGQINPNVLAAQRSQNCALENRPTEDPESYECVNGHWAKREASEINDADTRARFCQGLSDPDEQVQCYQDAAIEGYFAENGTNDPGNKKNTKEIIGKVGVGLAFLTAGILKPDHKACSSRLIQIGAYSHILGDFYGWYDNYQKSKSLVEEFHKIKGNGLGEEGQRQAFEYVATQQETLVKSLGVKKTTSMVTAIIYTVATAVAIIEAIPAASGALTPFKKLCGAGDEDTQNQDSDPKDKDGDNQGGQNNDQQSQATSEQGEVVGESQQGQPPTDPQVEGQQEKKLSRIEKRQERIERRRERREKNGGLFNPRIQLLLMATGILPYIFDPKIPDDMKTYQDPEKTILEKATSFWKALEIYETFKMITGHLIPLAIPKVQAQEEQLGRMFMPQHNPQAIGEDSVKGLAKAIKGLEKFIEKAMPSPVTRIAIGSMAGVSSWILYDHYRDTQKVVDFRAKEMRRLAKRFEDETDICNEQRNNTAGDTCYCYTQNATGERTPRRDRRADKLCQAMWIFSEPNHDPTEYGGPPLAKGTQACIAQTGQLDPNCSCRRRVNSKGVNACKKIPSQFGLTGNTNFTMTPFTRDFVKDMNSLMAGKTSPSSFNSASLAANYNRAKRFRDQALKKLNQVRKKAGKKGLKLSQIKGRLGRRVASLTNKTPRYGSGLINNANKPEGLTQGMDKATGDKLKDALKKVQKSEGYYKKAKGGRRRNSGDNFDFALGGPAGGGNEVMNVMDKQYDFEDNDVVKKPSESLFKILSYRYTVSGLRRLFPDEDLSTPANK